MHYTNQRHMKPNYAFMFIQWSEVVVVNGQLDITNLREGCCVMSRRWLALRRAHLSTAVQGKYQVHWWRNEQLATKCVSNRDVFAQKIQKMTGNYKQDIRVWFMSVKPSTILSSFKISFRPLWCYNKANNFHFKSHCCHPESQWNLMYSWMWSCMTQYVGTDIPLESRGCAMCTTPKLIAKLFQAPKRTSPR